jgi:hypothetical protein
MGLSLAALPCLAHDEDLPIRSASELRDWCRMETEAYFVGKGETPANWTASYTESGNTLKVSGKWRVNTEDVAVQCRAARGALRRYAKFEVGGAS